MARLLDFAASKLSGSSHLITLGQPILLGAVEKEPMEPPREITIEQIRERAYDLWERHHRPDGFEIEFWLLAEQELKAKRNRSSAQKSADESRTLSTDPEA